MLPARPTFWCFKTGNKELDQNPSASVLDWNYTQKNFQWNVLLLLGILNCLRANIYSNFLDQNNFVWFVGGGYALSEATKTSHLAEWIGHQLIGLDVLPPSGPSHPYGSNGSDPWAPEEKGAERRLFFIFISIFIFFLKFIGAPSLSAEIF